MAIPLDLGFVAMVRMLKDAEESARGTGRRGSDSEPWWVSLALRMGPVALLALGLAYFLATTVTGALTAMQKTQLETQQMLQGHVAEMTIQRQYLRVLCINAANEELVKVQRCLGIEPR